MQFCVCAVLCKHDVCFLTGEAHLQHHRLLSVLDGADLLELVVQEKEEGAGQQAHQAQEHAIVTRICVLVEHTVQTLAAHVHVTLVHDRRKNHQGKHLWRKEQEERL